MNKAISIAMIFLFTSLLAVAQTLDPDVTKKSLVRVEIKKGTKGYACTGFLWKKPEWVVTSLHAMKHGATYQVVYDNQFYRSAKVVKVFADADLVLLETDIDKRPLSTTVVPIKKYNPEKPKWREKLYAQGYHGGSKGHRTTPLEKGDAEPETLEELVVKEDEEALLRKLGFPKIDLDILFLNGSLLPGYSGSPIYNLKGELVAIGNGGLENGATDVSWAIPASYISNLENSGSTNLPDNLEQISLLMSSQVEVEIAPGNESEDAIQQQLEEDYRVYQGGAFEFSKTKNRSFAEMYNSSFETENLDFFIENLEDNNLQVDYEYIRFDLYEDLNNGATIAVPEDSELVYLPESGSFTVDISNYDLSEYFSLEYHGFKDEYNEIEDVDMAADMLLGQIDQMMGESYGGFYEDEDFSFSLELGDDAEVVYILYHSNGTKYEAYDDDYHALRIYFTILRKSNQYFYSMCSISLPTQKMQDATANGVNCEDNYESYPEACEFFEGFIRVQAAAQFTTFSGTMLTRN